jgi:hypothetical protein
LLRVLKAVSPELKGSRQTADQSGGHVVFYTEK